MKIVENKIVESAFELFLGAFEDRHPKKSLPRWFGSHTTYVAEVIGEEIFKISFFALPASAFGRNEVLVQTDGGYRVERIDPATGRRLVVISSSHADPIPLFEALVDVKKKTVSVTSDMDLNNFTQDELLLIARSM